MVCIVPLSQIHTVLVRVFQRNGTTRVCIYKDLFQGIDSHDCGESGKSFSLSLITVCWQNSLLFRVNQLLFY